jgi:hypothetical protein
MGVKMRRRLTKISMDNLKIAEKAVVFQSKQKTIFAEMKILGPFMVYVCRGDRTSVLWNSLSIQTYELPSDAIRAIRRVNKNCEITVE